MRKSLLEQYLETGEIRKEDAARMIARRKIFPCYFGSALKLQGVQELLDALRVYSVQKNYPEEFAARVYKISRDEQGNRLTHMKITGGSLKRKSSAAWRRRRGRVGGKGQSDPSLFRIIFPGGK